MKEISKKQFDKVVIALLGSAHVSITGVTHITMEAGKCAHIDDNYFADSKALKLVGEALKRKKRRSY